MFNKINYKQIRISLWELFNFNIMKSVLILDTLAEAENPNDPDYSGGQPHPHFRNLVNRRLVNFSEHILGAEKVKIEPVENLNFDDFCFLLNSNQGRVILPGSPHSVNDQDPWILDLRRALSSLKQETRSPILGICFGAQLLAVSAGGQVRRLESPRKGTVYISKMLVEMSHTEAIIPPENFEVLARSDGIPYVMKSGNDFAVQAHPEKTWVQGGKASPWKKLLALE